MTNASLSLDQIDALIRGAAIGGFLIVGLGLALASGRRPLAILGPVFMLCVIGHVIDGAIAVRAHGLHPWAWAWALSAVAGSMFWSFTLTLFGDDARFPWPRAAIPLGMLALAIIAASSPWTSARWVWLVFNLISAALGVHALLVTWRGWRGDLVEERRRLRAPIAIAAAGYMLFMAATDLNLLNFGPGPGPRLAQASFLLLLAIGSAAAFLRADPVLLGAALKADASAAPPTPAAPKDLDPADRGVLERLEKAMSAEELWRKEDLTIAALAVHVGAPEYRLRRLINDRLGFRNFAAFINARRIEAAKRDLRDPAKARVSVSTIAIELGFGSLGPFNRAFKDATGVTPSGWRAGES